MTVIANQPVSQIVDGIAPSPRILIVDELPVSRELVRRILAAEGFQTLLAGDGRQALEIAQATPVDLILLDAVLPDQSGFEFCAQLKGDHRLGDTPVIFLSALDDPGHRLEGLKAGGADYISKPFHAEEVLARVRVHLRTRRALQCLAYQQQASLAELRDAQRAILTSPDDVPEASFAVCYRPMGAVGGDIYDVLELGDDLFGYFVADVSGHSVGASFLTSAVKALLRQYSGPLYSGAETMRGINRVIHATLRDDQYLTACYARYYRRRRVVQFVSAGHPAPIHISACGRASTFAVESDPLGVFNSVVLENQEIPLEPGDRFYLFTDGLIEDAQLPAGGRHIGLERLTRACQNHQKIPLAAAVDCIVNAVRPSSSPPQDDLLLLGAEAVS